MLRVRLGINYFLNISFSRAKGSRPNSVNSYDSDQIRNVVRKEDLKNNEAHSNFDNHQIKFNDGLEQRGYNTITRDGNRLAVINA